MTWIITLSAYVQVEEVLAELRVECFEVDTLETKSGALFISASNHRSTSKLTRTSTLVVALNQHCHKEIAGNA